MKFIFIVPDMSWLYDYKSQFSLGVLYLSSILKSYGWGVGVFDTNIKDIKELEPANVFGFTAVHHTHKDCISLAKCVKTLYPHSKVVVGGPHATTNRESFLQVFDSIFVGEAENTIKEYIKDLDNNIEKQIYTSKDDVDIDEVLPDRKLVPDDYIRTASIFTDSVSYDDNGCTSIMFSRGCPYNCSFCASPQLYKNKLRFREIGSVVKEIQSIKDEFNIRQFRVQDDTFTVKKPYAKALCNELEKLNIFYRASTRVNHVDDSIVEHLSRSGCKEIGIGVEVADDKVLERLRKGITVEQVEYAISLFRKYGIEVRCFFMIGTPFDTKETIQANIDFLERNKIKHVSTGNYIAFPGTEMYNNQRDFNIKSTKQDSCQNISSHIKLTPNILRYDITMTEHEEIMKTFYDYSIAKGHIH